MVTGYKLNNEGEIYRYINLLKNKAKRDYANAYVSYLKSGGYGNPPEAKNLSVMGAQAVRLSIDGFKPWGGAEG